MYNDLHSVYLLDDKCIGCTDCIKRCPTEAIRVRAGKAQIDDFKCIDCGLCIKVCEQHAKKAKTDSIDIIKGYKYKVAIPAPALYAQFKKVHDVNLILTAIKGLGFDEVFEVAMAAEMVTFATAQFIAKGGLKRPIISSACPAIIRLISMRFPSLVENILPLIAPIEAAAIGAKDYLVKKGIPREDIGVFFISPCAAKNSYVLNPIGIEKSEISAVISIQDIYMDLMNTISKIKTPEKLFQSSAKGVDWAVTGGESRGVEIESAIAVDGVENVIKILEELENGQLQDVDFIEGLACTGGCVGGPLTVINSFVSKNRLRKIESKIKAMKPEDKRPPCFDYNAIDFNLREKIRKTGGLKLDEDMSKAIEKMMAIEELSATLPKIDCGSCGAPTCNAFAQDVVLNRANVEDCVFMLRNKVRALAEAMVDLAAKLPQTISEHEKGRGE